jgi:hypothetical protein
MSPADADGQLFRRRLDRALPRVEPALDAGRIAQSFALEAQWRREIVGDGVIGVDGDCRRRVPAVQRVGKRLQDASDLRRVLVGGGAHSSSFDPWRSSAGCRGAPQAGLTPSRSNERAIDKRVAPLSAQGGSGAARRPRRPEVHRPQGVAF